ncbi:hypothetical protein M9458_054414 [Cirrhinus mrigala]|uniref:Uncharacterized protein n=1 Tax=Cirrhinus mrigala TaxID=683832 RepID=A0ABD0MNV2_CIRMR
MPLRSCPSGCVFHLSPNNRHDRRDHCLGHEHADAAFAEGSCQACEDMPLSTLHSRAAFFVKKPRLTSTASLSGPSTSGYEAAAMYVEGERGDMSDVLPLLNLPLWPLSLSRWWMLKWPPHFNGQPRRSVFFPEGHEELTKSWKAPFSDRMRYTNSSSLTPSKAVRRGDFTQKRVEAPPSDDPADLESVWPGTSRSLCLTRIHSLPVVIRSNQGPPWYRCTGTQLAKGPSQPHCTDPVQSQGGQRTGSVGGSVLAQQNLVLGPCAPIINPSLAHSSEEGLPLSGEELPLSGEGPPLSGEGPPLSGEGPPLSGEGPPLSGEGHNLAPAPRSLEPPPVVPGRNQEDFRDLPPSVVNTLLQARAPSTKWLYDVKWRIFVNWCSSQGKDPLRCGIESVLSFLQGGLDRHLSAATLEVHVVAVSANHDFVEGRLVGRHDLLIRFLRGVRKLNPPRLHLIPSWDLAVVLQQDPFESLQSVNLNALSLKTALLTALTSVKRVGNLQGLSVNSSCLEFGRADSHIVLRPRRGYMPKFPSTPFTEGGNGDITINLNEWMHAAILYTSVGDWAPNIDVTSPVTDVT